MRFDVLETGPFVGQAGKSLHSRFLGASSEEAERTCLLLDDGCLDYEGFEGCGR
jgi:hypothetical protein